jgi:hypothetical protein
MLDLQDVFGRLSNVFRDPMPVDRSEQQRSENQQVESARQDGGAITASRHDGRQTTTHHGRLSTIRTGGLEATYTLRHPRHPAFWELQPP